MRKTLLVALLAAGTLGGLGTSVYSDAVNGPTTNPSVASLEGPLPRLIHAQFVRWMGLRHDLNLTPDQRQQIHAIVQSHRAEIIQVMKPVVEDRRALREAVLDPNSDEKSIRAAADNLGHSIGDAAVLAAQIKQEIAPILTDEQQQKLSDFRVQSDHAVDEFFQNAASDGQ
jgi:Spy/CpxP family protein refolding chaperone